MPNKMALAIADAFFQLIVCRFGMPAVIHSDQGWEFENNLMQELCLLCGAHKTRTTPYHPASDGLVERFNRTLLMMLAMFVVENCDDWDDLLPAVMMAYRSSIHASTGLAHIVSCSARNVHCLWMWAYHVVIRTCRTQLYDKRAVRRCLLWGIGPCAIIRRPKSVSWTLPGLDPILLYRSPGGLWVFNSTRIRRFSCCIVRILRRFRGRGVWCPGLMCLSRRVCLHPLSWGLVQCAVPHSLLPLLCALLPDGYSLRIDPLIPPNLLQNLSCVTQMGLFWTCPR